MTMDRASLRADLQSSLRNAAEEFDDADLDRHLDRAAEDLPRRRRLVLSASIALQADTAEYDSVPTDLVRPVFSRWANSARLKKAPWVTDYPPQRPRVTLVQTSGGRKLHVTPTLTATELAKHGETLQYDYEARYTIADAAADTTVKAEDRWLLLLRAQAESVRELALKNIDRPISVGDKAGRQTRNDTPGSLYQLLMEDFLRA